MRYGRWVGVIHERSKWEFQEKRIVCINSPGSPGLEKACSNTNIEFIYIYIELGRGKVNVVMTKEMDRRKKQ